VLAAGLFLLFSWGIPNQWVFLTGLAIAALATMAIGQIRLQVRYVILAVSGAVIVALAAFFAIPIKDGSIAHWQIGDVLSIKNALQHYAENHEGTFPISIMALVDEGLLKRFPNNRYSKLQTSESMPQFANNQLDLLNQMQPLGASQLPVELREQLEWPGNFVYLPRIEDDGKGAYTARGYSLLAFGLKHWDPGWWDAAQNYPIVVYYYNSETGVQQTWK